MKKKYKDCKHEDVVDGCPVCNWLPKGFPRESAFEIEEKEFATGDLGLYLRGLLCEGTQDCENSPNCPEGTDGCLAWDLFKLCKNSNFDIESFINSLSVEKYKQIERLNQCI